jgi:hypothetical protein
MKVGLQARTSVFTERDNNLIGNIGLIMERWKQYFYETLNIKNDVQIREEAMYRALNEQIRPPTKEDVREIIRTLKKNKSPGEDNISAQLILYFCKLFYMFRMVTPPIIRSICNCNCNIWHWSYFGKCSV